MFGEFTGVSPLFTFFILYALYVYIRVYMQSTYIYSDTLNLFTTPN